MQKRGEPLWLPEDTDLALEWQAEKRGTCKGCGQLLAESMDPSSLPHWVAEEIECQGCKVLAWRREALSEQDNGAPGIQVYVTKRDGGPGSG